MKYYIELTLISNDEVGFYALWSKVFTQIHLGLVEIKDAKQTVPIGVSFPEYAKDRLLGQKLRLFAPDEATLAKFDAAKWLARLTDYVHISSIKPVPSQVKGYATYSRCKPKLTMQQRAKHQAARHGISIDAALEYFKTLPEQGELLLPYIVMQSKSNAERFSLFISKKPTSTAVNGGFGTYGLSTVTTVPEF